MPDGGWNAATMRCPFYKHDSYKHKIIICESILDEKGSSTQRFRRQSDRLRQLECFCAGDYRKCEIYRMILQTKYPDE